ncbi:MAG: hypothetical protein MUF25_18780 [Pirellulaceae bacterium]|nr:hypothetical protein [Pirellulaceae bacterium]
MLAAIGEADQGTVCPGDRPENPPFEKDCVGQDEGNCVAGDGGSLVARQSKCALPEDRDREVEIKCEKDPFRRPQLKNLMDAHP